MPDDIQPSGKAERLAELRGRIAHLVEEYAQIKYEEAAFAPGQMPVPVSGKVLGAPELQHMVEASLDGWLTTGRFNEQFERRLAKFIGVRHLMTVNSGSSANLVAFMTLTSPKLGDRRIQKGDEVISVAAGFPTTVNPILQFGATPVFIDVELGTYNIDADLIEAQITPRTKAVMLAHTLGNPFNLTKIRNICDRHGLWLIEDTCDALGSTYEGKTVGTFGDIGTLSFYPAHHITMGEGGAVFMNDIELKVIAESFRDWGRDCFCAPGKDNTCKRRFAWQLGELPFGYDHKYIYSHCGYNLKITDMQAACGLAQMDRVEHFVEARKINFAHLHARMARHEDKFILPTATPGSDPSWFGFALTLRDDAPVTRVDLLQELAARKIGTRLLFAGNLIRQPYMADQKFRIGTTLANTEKVMKDTFWLGVYPGLGSDQLDYVADVIDEILSR